MTYNVFRGTLNLAQSINHSLIIECMSCLLMWGLLNTWSALIEVCLWTNWTVCGCMFNNSNSKTTAAATTTIFRLLSCHEVVTLDADVVTYYRRYCRTSCLFEKLILKHVHHSWCSLAQPAKLSSCHASSLFKSCWAFVISWCVCVFSRSGEASWQ